MKFYVNVYHDAEGKVVQSQETFSYREQAAAAVLTFVDTVELEVNKQEPQVPAPEVQEQTPEVDPPINEDHEKTKAEWERLGKEKWGSH